MVVLILRLILVLSLIVLQSHQILDKPPDQKIEITSILQQVDRSINPCDDFYQFSCGNATHLFKTIRVLSELAERQALELYNEAIKDSDHYMVQMVKKLFHACLDVSTIEKDGLKTIKGVLAKLGGWPTLLGQNWSADKFNWIQTTYKLRELGYMFPVFLDVLVDLERESMPEVSLPRAHRYIVGNSTDVTAYMLKVATVFGADRQQALKDIEDIIEFGEDLQEVVDDYIGSKKHAAKYNVDEYQKLVEGVNWLEFLNKIISPAGHISKRDMVIFPDPGGLKLWLDKITNTPKRIQANYMLWKVIEQIIPYLGADLQRYKHQGKRSDFCLKEVERRFPINPITIMYLRKYLPRVKKLQVEHLINNIKTEVAHIIKKFDWLTNEEQRTSIDKANNLKVVLGLPGDYFEIDMLNQLSVDMKAVDNESFLELLAQANRNLESQKYAGVIRKLGFPGRNYLINYDPRRNLLYVPAALLQSPLYDETRPNYLNYGNIGLLIGGELSGIFQAKNSTHSEKQELTNSTKAGLQKMHGCISSDLDPQVFAVETDLTTIRTIQEYVVAQRAVYEAYTKWAKNNGEEPGLTGASYTSNQLFWISTAFCNPKSQLDFGKSVHRQFADFRVYTAVRNNPSFAKDFNCPSGARMNPVKKCKLLDDFI